MENTETFGLTHDAREANPLYRADFLVILDRRGDEVLAAVADHNGNRLGHLPPVWLFSDEIEPR